MEIPKCALTLQEFDRYNPGAKEKAAQIFTALQGLKIHTAIELLNLCTVGLLKQEFTYCQSENSDSNADR